MGTLWISITLYVAIVDCRLPGVGELDNGFHPVGKEMIRYEDVDNEWEDTEGQVGHVLTPE